MPTRPIPPIAVDSTIRAAVAEGATVAFNLSGGKDSGAVSHAAMAWLDAHGHPRDRRLALHADLGRAEWRSTPATVAATAERLGLPLIVVQRAAGDLVARWEGRFENGKGRFECLDTYGLVGPWSSKSLRFCTSELKSNVLGPELARRFRGRTIIQVIGLRREESPDRRATPVSKADTRFASAGNRHGTRMLVWHPGVDWTVDEVLAHHARYGIPLHEAYTVYGSTRLSCAFCIMASAHDLRAATKAAENLDLYRHLVRLEAVSTFSFQPGRWLGDVAPHLLPPALARDLEHGKRGAAERRACQARMPPDLRYVKGWPPRLPTRAEAAFIVAGRRPILARHGLEDRFPEPAAVIGRFEELIEARRPAA